MTFLSHKQTSVLFNNSLLKQNLSITVWFRKFVCLFNKRHHIAKSLVLGPQGPKQYIFDNHFYSKNAKKLRFHVFLIFHVRKHMTSALYQKWAEFNWNKFTFSCEFDPLQVKQYYHMFSSIIMEEYMERELSDTF